MINLFRKNKGAATLILTMTLMVLTSLIILFAAQYNRLQTIMTANLNSNHQAYQAAEAGLEFGIAYLKQNDTTILANPVSGYIPSYTNAATTNVVLANNSKFTIAYSNPIANNYQLINIASTGVSADGTSTRVVSQLVQFGSLLEHTPTVPLITKGTVSMGGNATVSNTTSGTTIQSASTVTLAGSSQTVLQSGVSSTPGNIHSDITQNSTTLANTSNNDFFANYFSSSTNNVQNNVEHLYNNSGNTNYSSTLNGMTGTSIWINQTNGSTATINGTTTIGSAANPVLLIVNGNLSLSGSLTIYGFVYVFGENDISSLTGSVNIIGGVSSTDNLNMVGSTSITFNPTVLSNLQNNASMKFYAKVPSSWKDF